MGEPPTSNPSKKKTRDKRCTNDDSKEEEREDGLYSAGVRAVRVTEKESKPCFV